MEDRLAMHQAAAADFAERINGVESVEEVAVFASVAGGDPYPSDLDLAIFLNALDELPMIAKVMRQVQNKTGGLDLFVFERDRRFLGNV